MCFPLFHFLCFFINLFSNPLFPRSFFLPSPVSNNVFFLHWFKYLRCELGTPYQSTFRRNANWVCNRYTGYRAFFFLMVVILGWERERECIFLIIYFFHCWFYDFFPFVLWFWLFSPVFVVVVVTAAAMILGWETEWSRERRKDKEEEKKLNRIEKKAID